MHNFEERERGKKLIFYDVYAFICRNFFYYLLHLSFASIYIYTVVKNIFIYATQYHTRIYACAPITI